LFIETQPQECLFMKKSLMIAAFAYLSCYGVALADTTQADVDANVKAIAEDDRAIAKQKANIKVNQAQKAKAKLSGNPVDQASQSIQIGTNKAAIAAKKIEKKIEQKILEHNREELQEDENEMEDEKMDK